MFLGLLLVLAIFWFVLGTIAVGLQVFLSTRKSPLYGRILPVFFTCCYIFLLGSRCGGGRGAGVPALFHSIALLFLIIILLLVHAFCRWKKRGGAKKGV